MKEIIDKISSYNLFNYLFPGIIFVVLLKQVTSFNLVLDNDFLGVFLYYFIGLVISRLGSLILEPVFKKIKLVTFSDYKDFIEASKNDEKIELFSEINNTYRTLASLFLCLLISMLYERLVFDLLSKYNIDVYIVTIGLLILFVFSYKKQTSYINKRIAKNKSK
jgi:hypothetical protein